MKFRKYPIGVVLVLATLSLANLRHTSAVIHQPHKKSIRSSKKSTSWQGQLKKELASIEKNHRNQIGLYIKDLDTGEEFSHHADEIWYLASTVKIPIAMEVLRQVDAKKLTLEDKIKVLPEDYVDGNGPLKTLKPGEEVTVRYLIEQMIIWSDNMASDMLIRVVGLDNVNALVKSLSPTEFNPITTLKDVRRNIYGEVHGKAFDLNGKNFMELKEVRDPTARIVKLASLLQLKKNELKLEKLEEAYGAYYRKGLNSATPRSYAKVLEALWSDDKLLSPSSRDFMVKTMLKTQTGKKRIRSGLKSPWVFAHKTGTQFERIGDVGYIMDPTRPQRRPVIVVSFVRDVSKVKTATKLLEKVAKTISKSGVL